MDEDEQIIDGEIAEESEHVSEETSEGGASVSSDENSQRLSQILKLEDMIKRYIGSIDTASVEVKKHSEMLEDIFTNDPTYQKHLDLAKEATKIKSKTKSELTKRTDVAQLSEKIKEIKTQIKEMKDALSDYLMQYKELSGANEIELDDGQVREIVSSVKLVKKSIRQFDK